MRIFRTGVCAFAVLGLVASVEVSRGYSWEHYADLLCKLKTGNPDSVADSFSIALVLAEPGFSCPFPAFGTQVPNVVGRGVEVPMFYSEPSLLATHKGGQSVTNVVCTTPTPTP